MNNLFVDGQRVSAASATANNSFALFVFTAPFLAPAERRFLPMNRQNQIDQESIELAILETLYSSHDYPAPKQRDLADIVGASLGMTNAILKRLAQKGLIVIRRLNSRNIHYAVTPDGVNEIAHRSYRYVKRTIKNVVYYRYKIEEAIAEAKKRGKVAVKLIGGSDLDFIVEHACAHYGLAYEGTHDFKETDITAQKDVFWVFAEETALKVNTDDVFYLTSILYGGL